MRLRPLSGWDWLCPLLSEASWVGHSNRGQAEFVKRGKYWKANQSVCERVAKQRFNIGIRIEKKVNSPTYRVILFLWRELLNFCKLLLHVFNRVYTVRPRAGGSCPPCLMKRGLNSQAINVQYMMPLNNDFRLAKIRSAVIFWSFLFLGPPLWPIGQSSWRC